MLADGRLQAAPLHARTVGLGEVGLPWYSLEGKADALVKAAARIAVLSVLSSEPDLEEIFLAYYAADEGGSRAA